MTKSQPIHLHILQLEGYEPLRFLGWWVRHPFQTKLENKKPLVWTVKARFIYSLSGGFWPLMFIVLLLLWPIEQIFKRRAEIATRQKVGRLKKKGLKVIGVTGSFGKTSTKEYLYQILKTKYRVLRTPESYNTLLGIAKVVQLELDEGYDYFICEMSAYHKGEIAQLCQMVDPELGILTGINEQHIERFGSQANIIQAKFELVDYVLGKRGQVVVNLGSKLVADNIGSRKVTGYGQGEYRHPSEQNIEGAMFLAKIAGVVSKPKELSLPEHRLKLTHRSENLTIIDDAYSGNTTGFEAAMKYLQAQKGYKIVITPGITELASQNKEVHKRLGTILNNTADKVLLVGKNERTQSMAQSLDPDKYTFVTSVGEWRDFVDTEKKTVVLFENDLPDNY